MVANHLEPAFLEQACSVSSVLRPFLVQLEVEVADDHLLLALVVLVVLDYLGPPEVPLRSLEAEVVEAEVLEAKPAPEEKYHPYFHRRSTLAM